FVVPLRIGAFIVAAWMFVWMAYSGLSLMLASYGTSNIIWKILGVPFFLVAAVALYGAHAIYHEIPHRVATFVRLYLFSIIFYFLAQIVFIVAVEIAVASAAAAAKKNCEDAQANLPANAKTDCSVTYSGGFPIFGWLVPFVFAFIWQAYLYVCIRSYSLELSERNEKQPTTTTYNIGA
ncbi:4960_t:CDS:2, partial [Acaulospora morrowiae]